MFIELLPLLITLCWILIVISFLVSVGKVYRFREELTGHSLSDPELLPTVSVIIPARNEEPNIATCLDGLLNSHYPADRLQVIVMDDQSSDRTPEIVSTLAARHPNLRLIHGRPLPAGWSGKTHSCHQGAAQAEGEWLVFLDADTYAKPDLLPVTLSHAMQQRFDVLSIIPFQILGSLQERLWLPGVFLGFASFIDFGRVNDPQDPFALANGQFLLFRREAYERIGGHAAIKQELNDDLAFARLAKQQGLYFHCLFGEQLVETRMYRSLEQVWKGFSRNAAEIIQASSCLRLLRDAFRSVMVAAGTVAAPALTLIAYRSAPTLSNLLAVWTAALASGALLLLFRLSIKALRLPARYSFTMPLGLSLHAMLCLNSFWQTRYGTRKWKDREYPS